MPSQCIWAALEMQYCKAQTSARNSRWLEPVLLCNLESLQALGHREAPNPLTPVFHHEFVTWKGLKSAYAGNALETKLQGKAGTALPRDRIAESTRIDKMDVAVEHRDQRPG